MSIDGGFGFLGGSGKAGDAGLGSTKGGQVAGGATKDAASSISTGSGGFGIGAPAVAAASGHRSLRLRRNCLLNKALTVPAYAAGRYRSGNN